MHKIQMGIQDAIGLVIRGIEVGRPDTAIEILKEIGPQWITLEADYFRAIEQRDALLAALRGVLIHSLLPHDVSGKRVVDEARATLKDVTGETE